MRVITLVTGQSCSIQCEGSIRVKLYTGDLEIAGAPLEHNKVETLVLSIAKPLVVYTLEGCVFGLQPDCADTSAFSTEVGNFPSGMGSLLRLLRKGFDVPSSSASGLRGSADALRVVVAGSKGSGRFFAACAIANTMNRSLGNGTIFCDLTTSVDGQLSRLGCLGCAETHSDVPLWEGMQWSSYSSSMLFHHGLTTSTVGSSDLPQFLTAASSACESAIWMSGEKKNAPIVFVLPSFDESVSKEQFYRSVLESIRPTHIVFTGDDGTSAQQTLGRLFPSARFSHCGTVATSEASKPPVSSRVAKALFEYFAGTQLNPLGASVITVPISSLKFVVLEGEGDASVAARPLAVSADESLGTIAPDELKGCVCAVSLGLTPEEIPYANVAGFVVISNVYPAADEVEIVSPSSEAMVPGAFLIVSSDRALRGVATGALLS